MLWPRDAEVREAPYCVPSKIYFHLGPLPSFLDTLSPSRCHTVNCGPSPRPLKLRLFCAEQTGHKCLAERYHLSRCSGEAAERLGTQRTLPPGGGCQCGQTGPVGSSTSSSVCHSPVARTEVGVVGDRGALAAVMVTFCVLLGA